MLAVNSDIFIFDEPYANLDYSGVKQVNKIIGELKNQGKTIIILTHEIEKCLAFADKFAKTIYFLGGNRHERKRTRIFYAGR